MNHQQGCRKTQDTFLINSPHNPSQLVTTPLPLTRDLVVGDQDSSLESGEERGSAPHIVVRHLLVSL